MLSPSQPQTGEKNSILQLPHTSFVLDRCSATGPNTAEALPHKWSKSNPTFWDFLVSTKFGPACVTFQPSSGPAVRFFFFFFVGCNSYRWWFRNPANQLRLVVFPIIYKVLYIPGGAGILPSVLFSFPFFFSFPKKSSVQLHQFCLLGSFFRGATETPQATNLDSKKPSCTYLPTSWFFSMPSRWENFSPMMVWRTVKNRRFGGSALDFWGIFFFLVRFRLYQVRVSRWHSRTMPGSQKAGGELVVVWSFRWDVVFFRIGGYVTHPENK